VQITAFITVRESLCKSSFEKRNYIKKTAPEEAAIKVSEGDYTRKLDRTTTCTAT
jgi:hypothetical protein